LPQTSQRGLPGISRRTPVGRATCLDRPVGLLCLTRRLM